MLVGSIASQFVIIRRRAFGVPDPIAGLTQLKDNTVPITQAAGAFVDDVFYVFGGSTESGNELDTLWAYDPYYDYWIVIDDGNADPLPRRSHAGTAWEGKFYIHGGLDGGTVRDDLWEYDTFTKQWTQLSTGGPGARFVHSMVAIDGKLYVYGGHNGTQLSDFWVYDIASGAWTQLASNQARSYNRITALRDKVYLFGGYTGSASTDEFWEYDIPTNTWAQLTSGPPARHNHTINVLNDEIYVHGGNDTNSNYYGDLWKYNIEAQTWEEIVLEGAPTMSGHVAGVFRDKIYQFSGSDGTDKQDETWAYDLSSNIELTKPDEDIWIKKSSYPPVRNAHAMGTVNDSLYMFGGSVGDTVPSNDLWKYDFSNEKWIEVLSKGRPPVRRNTTGRGYNGKFYVFGGYDGTNLYGDLWEYDPATNHWTSLSIGPAARNLAVSMISGDSMYIHGGTSGGYRNDLWRYDFATDTWTQLTSGGSNNAYHAGTTIDGKIYIYGGYTGSTELNELWEYDIASDTWTQKTDGPSARRNHVMASYNGKVYSIGGYDGTNGLAETWEYDPSSDSWTQLSPPPATLSAASSSVYNGKIYISGGSTSDGKSSDLLEYDISTDSWAIVTTGVEERSTQDMLGAVGTDLFVFGGSGYEDLLDTTWKYNIETEEWIPASTGPSKRRNFATGIVDGVFYVFGGYDGSNWFNDLWEYDPSTDTWTELAPTGGPPEKRYVTAGVGYNGKFYIYGGYYWSGGHRNDLWEYDVAANTWTQLASSGVDQSYYGFAAYDGNLYAVGGFDGSNKDNMMKYDISADSWTHMQPLPSPRRNVAASAFNGKVYVYGGTDNDGNTIDEFLEYDIASDSWNRLQSRPFDIGKRGSFSMVTAEDTLFTFGGGYDGNNYNDIWKFKPNVSLIPTDSLFHWSIDKRNGTTILDSSGNGYTFDYTGFDGDIVKGVAGKDSLRNLLADNGYATIASGLPIGLPEETNTHCVWIYFDGVTTNHLLLGNGGYWSRTDRRFRIFINPTGNLGARLGQLNSNEYAGIDLPDGTFTEEGWYHIRFEYTVATALGYTDLKLWIDNTLVAEKQDSYVPNGGDTGVEPNIVGAIFNNGNYQYPTYFDDWYCFIRALTDDEATLIYEKGTA